MKDAGQWEHSGAGLRGPLGTPRREKKERSGSEVFVTEWPQCRPGEGRWVRGGGVPGTGPGGSRDRF